MIARIGSKSLVAFATIMVIAAASDVPSENEENFVLSLSGESAKQTVLADSIIKSPHNPNTSFKPEKPGDYTFEVTVTDGCSSFSDDITYSVQCDAQPKADAGDAKRIVKDCKRSKTAFLDGHSSVSQGDTSYAWKLTHVPDGSQLTTDDLQQRNGQDPFFIPDAVGLYTASLTIEDCCGVSQDHVDIHYVCNGSPVSNAGEGQTVELGEAVTVDGSASQDVDEDELSYEWTFISKPQDSGLRDEDISSGDSEAKAVFHPDRAGSYVLQLRVSDCCHDSISTVIIEAVCNDAPTANAGPDDYVTGLQKISLDGTSSADPDGDTLTFAWKFVDIPSASKLTNADIEGYDVYFATFMPDELGLYEIELSVSDCCSTSYSRKKINVGCNDAPFASAGDDRTVTGTRPFPVVELDGCRSMDPNGDDVTYRWNFSSKPEGSTLSDGDIVSSTDCQASFTPDVLGLYELEITVNDRCTDSKDAVRVIVGCNRFPQANAGPDQAIAFTCQPSIVDLDGSASTDEDGDDLQFSWGFSSTPEGSTLRDADIENQHNKWASFTPDVLGSYEIVLTVSDSCTRDTDKIRITYSCNQAPRAVAGPDRLVTGIFPWNGDIVLDGSESTDPDGDDLNYEWSLISVPEGSALTGSSIKGPSQSMPSFQPDQPGSYEIELAVNDCCTTTTDRVVIKVSCGNPPTANAGYDQYLIQECSDSLKVIELDGSGSYDPDGNDVSYSWRFASVPEGSQLTDSDIQNRNSAQATFTINSDNRHDHSDEYVLELVVGDTCRDVVDQVKITYCCNDKPTANAGVDKAFASAPPFDAVTLDGSASADPNDDILQYKWTVVQQPEDSLISDYSIQDTASAVTSFAPDVRGEYEMQLSVADCCTTVVDSVKITVTCDSPPFASAGKDRTVEKFCDQDNIITLDGSESNDPNEEELSFEWSFISVPEGSSLTDSAILHPSSAMASFQPDEIGNYEFKLTVSDGCSTVSDNVIVTFTCEGKPIANAGDEHTYVQNPPFEIVHLSGLGSSDPDGEILTYQWSFVSLPLGSRLVSSDIAHSTPSCLGATFVPDAPGCYDFELEVQGCCARGRDTTRVCVSCNEGPTAKAGADQEFYKGATAPQVELDGCESSDPENDGLTYGWRFSRKPSDSALDDSDIFRSTSCKPTFSPDVTGSYELELTVFDGCTPARDKVSVMYRCNHNPTAHAGKDQTVVHKCDGSDSVVELDGSATSDPDEDPLTYDWTFTRIPEGSALTDSDIVGRDAEKANFVPDAFGAYQLKLTVSDWCFSVSDKVFVTFHCNEGPVANAGTDQDITAYPYPMINLFGTRSKDPEGDDITYSWTFVNVPHGSHLTTENIVDSSLPRAVFIPDVQGVYVLALTVADCCSDNTDEVKVTINHKGCNEAPIVDAGADRTEVKMCLGGQQCDQEINLDGTDSYDPDGDPLTYKWKFAKKPFESILSDTDIGYSNEPVATFTPDVPGEFVLILDVTDGCSSKASEVSITYTCNSAPIADAGENKRLDSGSGDVLPKVNLDAGNSYDPDDDELTYTWSFIDTADGSCLDDNKLSCDGEHGRTCSFYPDVRGTYELQLVVSDCCSSSTATVDITIACSTAPEACAGEDQEIASCQPFPHVSLTGTEQSGEDAESLVWQWTFESVPKDSTLTDADIENSKHASAYFSPDVMGDYIAKLTIKDGCSTNEDTVRIHIGCNTGPSAHAGHDVSVRWDGSRFPKVALDGDASTDPEDDALNYSWSFVTVPGDSKISDIDISNGKTSHASFWPDVAGTYELELTVSDCCSPSRDRLKVHVGCNGVPSIQVGDNLTLQKSCQDTIVNLNGQAVDPEGDKISYQWKFTNIPPGSKLTNAKIANSNSPQASFYPDVTGSFFEVQLCASDGCTTLCDRVKVEYECNDPPQADAGQDQTLNKDCTETFVTLDGSGSHDPDGDALSYNWRFTNFPGAEAPELLNPDTVAPSFAPVDTGIYELELTVTDCCEIPALRCTCMKDRVLVTLSCHGSPPHANAGEDKVISWDETQFPTVHLDGTGSEDPDNDRIAFSWSFVSKPYLSNLGDSDIQNRESASPIFVPDVNGEYTLRLTTADCCFTESDDVTIVVKCDNPPVAMAGADQHVKRSCRDSTATGSPIFLEGNQSYDPEGEDFSCTWSFICKPPKSSLTDANIQKSSNENDAFFYADQLGEYALELTCYDGCSYVTDEVVATVSCNDAPKAVAVSKEQKVLTMTQQCGENELVELDGSGSSDANDDPLAMSWTFVSKPSNSQLDDSSIQAADTSVAYFRPDKTGEYIIQLSVSDCCQTDIQTVVVNVQCSQPPKAAASSEESVEWDGIRDLDIELDGSATSDSDTDDVHYTWTLTDKPATSDLTSNDINGATAAKASFQPDDFGCYSFKLTVTDCCSHDSAETTVCLVCSEATAATAGDDTWESWTCDSEYDLAVDFDGKDDDGVVTYDWKLKSFNGDNVPQADAGCDYEGLVGRIVHLDQASAVDPNGDAALTFTWSFLDKPSDSHLTDSDIQARHNRQAFFSPDVDGDWYLQFSVSDEQTTVVDVAHVRVYLNAGSATPSFASVGGDAAEDWKPIGLSLLVSFSVMLALFVGIAVNYRREIARDLSNFRSNVSGAAPPAPARSGDQSKLLTV